MSTILKALRRLEEDELGRQAATLEESVVTPAEEVRASRRNALLVGLVAGGLMVVVALGLFSLLGRVGSAPTETAALPEPIAGRAVAPPSVATRPEAPAPSPVSTRREVAVAPVAPPLPAERERMAASDPAPRGAPITVPPTVPLTATALAPSPAPSRAPSPAPSPALQPAPDRALATKPASGAGVEREVVRSAPPVPAPAPVARLAPPPLPPPARSAPPEPNAVGTARTAPYPLQQRESAVAEVPDADVVYQEILDDLPLGSPERRALEAPHALAGPGAAPESDVVPALSSPSPPPSRPATVGPVAVVERVPEPPFAVVQTVWHPTPSRRVAVVELEDGSSKRLAEGESLGGFRFTTIGLASVELERGDVKIQKRVGNR